jgi:hypothetical protein
MAADIRSKGMCVPLDYHVTNTAHRALKIILGTAKLRNPWSGIQHNGLA